MFCLGVKTSSFSSSQKSRLQAGFFVSAPNALSWKQLEIFNKYLGIPLVVVQALARHRQLAQLRLDESLLNEPVSGLGGQDKQVFDPLASGELFHLLQQRSGPAALAIVRVGHHAGQLRRVRGSNIGGERVTLHARRGPGLALPLSPDPLKALSAKLSQPPDSRAMEGRTLTAEDFFSQRAARKL